MTDANGKKYLRLQPQLLCNNLGHKNPALIKAIVEQGSKMPYINPSYSTDLRAKSSETLVPRSRQGLLLHLRHQGNKPPQIAQWTLAEGTYKVISRYTSYHGATAASIACTGDRRRWSAEPTMKVDGTVFTPDCILQVPFHQKYPECRSCTRYVEYMLKNEGNVAAIIVRPIITPDIFVPVEEFCPTDSGNREEARRAAHRRRGDDRLGPHRKVVRVDHCGVMPDILSTAKGITSAWRRSASSPRPARSPTTSRTTSSPTATPTRRTRSPSRRPSPPSTSTSASTYFENPTIMGAPYGGSAGLTQRAPPSIGDVRGIGLFWAGDGQEPRHEEAIQHAARQGQWNTADGR